MAEPIQKFEELKDKSADELNKLLLDLRKEQYNLRFSMANGTLDNTAKMRKIRRSIARVKTAQNKNKSDKAA